MRNAAGIDAAEPDLPGIGEIFKTLCVPGTFEIMLTRPAITTVKEVTGETTSDGFDVDFSGTLLRNLYLIAGYGFNNARYTHSTGITGSVSSYPTSPTG